LPVKPFSYFHSFGVRASLIYKLSIKNYIPPIGEILILVYIDHFLDSAILRRASSIDIFFAGVAGFGDAMISLSVFFIMIIVL
jgi:hypothetical protein